jgi:hypothetical protein
MIEQKCDRRMRISREEQQSNGGGTVDVRGVHTD